MQSAAKHLTITKSNQHVSLDLSTALLHCDFSSLMTTTWRDPSVVSLPLDDVREQANGFLPCWWGDTIKALPPNDINRSSPIPARAKYAGWVFLPHPNQRENSIPALPLPILREE